LEGGRALLDAVTALHLLHADAESALNAAIQERIQDET